MHLVEVSQTFGHPFLNVNVNSDILFKEKYGIVGVAWTHAKLKEGLLYKYSMKQALLLLNPTEKSSDYEWPCAIQIKIKHVVQQQNSHLS